MVATTMREVDMLVDITKPTADQAVKIEDKDNVDFVYIGFPIDADTYGENARIQLDDQLANEPNQVADWKRSKQREGMTVFETTTSLKVDEEVGMKIVADVKESLRDIKAVKINYSAQK